MNAKQTAKQIVSNISSFCVGYFGKAIPPESIPALEKSTETEVKSYHPQFYADGYIVRDRATQADVYRASSEKLAQELADCFTTYV